jgi:UDP-N-acetylmuramoylalanine--D-glutamate ligase
MSSHQLEDSILAPHIAVLLNLFPEHLDRYASLDAYYSAKMRILTGQLDGDLFIYNADLPEIASRIGHFTGRRQMQSFSSRGRTLEGAYLDGDRIVLSEGGAGRPFFEAGEGFRLKGRHNLMNAMAAILAARAAGAVDEAIRNGLLTFGGLEHRLEYAGTFAGILFYNDSIATIPEAAIAALQALPGTDTIILGGYDRGLDYGNLAEFLSASPVRNLIFMGQAGARMAEKMRLTGESAKSLFMVNSMEEAFEIIPGVTGKGRICLLSPAAASYDLFRNFEERGKLFKKLAGNL